MDNMLEHPGTELQLLIKEKGLTQKAFASILGKKVSEVNELLKGKRNITIQRDYLLHQTLGTPIKYWILKQIDYDYSLLDIDESSLSTPHPDKSGSSPNREQNSNDNFTPLGGGDGEARGGGLQHTESFGTQSATHSVVKIQENVEQMDSSADESASEGQSKPQEIQIESQETSNQEPKKEVDEDHQKRARIFKSF